MYYRKTGSRETNTHANSSSSSSHSHLEHSYEDKLTALTAAAAAARHGERSFVCAIQVARFGFLPNMATPSSHMYTNVQAASTLRLITRLSTWLRMFSVFTYTFIYTRTYIRSTAVCVKRVELNDKPRKERIDCNGWTERSIDRPTDQCVISRGNERVGLLPPSSPTHARTCVHACRHPVENQVANSRQHSAGYMYNISGCLSPHLHEHVHCVYLCTERLHARICKLRGSSVLQKRKIYDVNTGGGMQQQQSRLIGHVNSSSIFFFFSSSNSSRKPSNPLKARL